MIASLQAYTPIMDDFGTHSQLILGLVLYTHAQHVTHVKIMISHGSVGTVGRLGLAVSAIRPNCSTTILPGISVYFCNLSLGNDEMVLLWKSHASVLTNPFFSRISTVSLFYCFTLFWGVLNHRVFFCVCVRVRVACVLVLPRGSPPPEMRSLSQLRLCNILS